MTGTNGWERRIGGRHEVGSHAIGWNVVGDAVLELATLLDLSVSGATVLATVDPALQVGSQLVADYDGARGRVVIRRVAPAPVDGRCVYGIEFIDTNPALAQALYRLLETPESAHLHDAWDGRWVD